ncbi:MAG: hypothetical protein AB7K68_15675 [Bacteriovoracia bacterium]
MRKIAGINIQFPISQLILKGEKTIETRTYPIPSHYVGRELAIIETPGVNGDFEARIVGTIIFSGCFAYENQRSFYADQSRHRVSSASPWRWTDERPKWGWEISKVVTFGAPIPAPKRRGIVYTKDVEI